MKTKKASPKKKTVPAKPEPKLEYLPTGKKDERGSELYYLYINGKSDKTLYAFDGRQFVCTSAKTKHAELIFSLSCKSFPDETLISIDFNASLVNGILQDERTLWLSKEKNIFTMYIYYETCLEMIYDMADIDYFKLINKMKDFIRKKNPAGLTIEKGNDDLIVIVTARPGETVREMYERLINGLQLQMDKLKIHLLREIKKLEKDVIANSLKWE